LRAVLPMPALHGNSSNDDLAPNEGFDYDPPAFFTIPK